MLERILNQLLSAHVDDIVAVVEDGVELRVDTLLHQLRRVIAVDSVHFVIDKALQVLGRIFYLRREQILGQ